MEALGELPDVDGFLVGGASLKPTFTERIAPIAPSRAASRIARRRAVGVGRFGTRSRRGTPREHEDGEMWRADEMGLVKRWHGLLDY